MSAAGGPAGALRAGDLVVAGPAVDRAEPVGRIESVLATSRGTRLVVERAYAPGTYVVLDGTGLAPGGAVFDLPGAAPEAGGPRWVVTAGRPGALPAGAVYRRVLGRLQ